MKQYERDPGTGTLKVVEKVGNGNGRSQAGKTWYAVEGDTRKDLLGFCLEDGLDIVGTSARSTAALEGRAINMHVESAVQDYTAKEKTRRAVLRKAQEASKASVQQPAKDKVAA